MSGATLVISAGTREALLKLVERCSQPVMTAETLQRRVAEAVEQHAGVAFVCWYVQRSCGVISIATLRTLAIGEGGQA